MRQDQLDDFKKDVKAGLSLDLLSKRYNLPVPEIRKGIAYVNRGWLECFLTGFRQLFRNIVFQAKMKFTILKIQRLLK
jgi:hypothetical protein